MDPKHAFKTKLEGDEKAKVQNVPKGKVITMDEAHARTAAKSGKLKLYVAEEATAAEPSSSDEIAGIKAAYQEDLDAADKALKEAQEALKAAKKDLTAVKKDLTAVKKDLKFAQA